MNISTEHNEVIIHALGVLCDLYDWEKEESNGRDPLIPGGLVRSGYGKTRLKYWAMLLRNWTRSEPLSRLINFSINYHTEKGDIWFYEEGRPKNERFMGDQRQINVIIEQIMSDIENGLRFKIEKYFLNYYLLCKYILGEENAGDDWSEFIEYGTTNKRVIEMQNLGFSRGASNYILNHHSDLLSFDDDGHLLEFKEKELLDVFDRKDEHYEEIVEIIG